MVQVVGVRFRQAGKVYFFSPNGLAVNRGDDVVVETARGPEMGHVVSDIRELEEKKLPQALKNVIRLATQEDRELVEANRAKEKEALKICREKVEKHNLDMKLVRCEYSFDGKKILFYFTADGRVDFRELVKDLASVFRTRIELRQIGVRDETWMLGGIGICGRALCCTTYLSDFQPVSIKMAKEQGLSLNPSKISGVCGRLMCCLNNEEETYEYLNSKLPSKNDVVTTPEGERGTVASLNILRQRVSVLVGDEDGQRELREYSVEDLEFTPRKKKSPRPQQTGNRGDGRKERKKQPRDGQNAPDGKNRNEEKDGEAAGKKSRSRRRNRSRNKGDNREGAPQETAVQTPSAGNDGMIQE